MNTLSKFYMNLLEQAISVMENSYSPYSNFRVGAAILGNDGNIYTGTNIENSSYGATICAEQAAIAKAISCGVKSITAVAIVSDSDKPITPCGICRQVLSEFSDSETTIVCGNINTLEREDDSFKIYKMCELMPDSFNHTFLNKNNTD